TGRVSPRWSWVVSVWLPADPLSITGLVRAGSIVGVAPPLGPRAPSCGSMVRFSEPAEKQAWAPTGNSKFGAPLVGNGGAPEQFPPFPTELAGLAMMVFEKFRAPSPGELRKFSPRKEPNADDPGSTPLPAKVSLM